MVLAHPGKACVSEAGGPMLKSFMIQIVIIEVHDVPKNPQISGARRKSEVQHLSC